MDARTYRRQLLGSLLVAAMIVVVAIVVVTAKLGPTSVVDEEARIERQELREDRRRTRSR